MTHSQDITEDSNKCLSDMQKQIDIICSGDFSENDVLAFMIKLRSLKPNRHLLDLCNFFSHPKGRNQGESHDLISKFLSEFICALENNSSVKIVAPLFTRPKMIEWIVKIISAKNLKLNLEEFKSHSERFFELMIEALDGIEYKVDELVLPKVKCCKIKKENNEEAFFCFQLQNLASSAKIRRDGIGFTCVRLFYNGDKHIEPFEITMG